MPLGSRRPLRLPEVRPAVASALPGVRVAKGIRRCIARLETGASDVGATVGRRLPDVDWAAQDALFAELVSAITNVDPGAEERGTLAWYLGALEQRDRFAGAWERFFRDVDALVLPAGATTAFTHRDTGAELDVDGKPASYWEHGRLAAFCNLAGLPTLPTLTVARWPGRRGPADRRAARGAPVVRASPPRDRP